MAGRICLIGWSSYISRDLEANPASDCVTVTLGDYIDRGPDSRGVLDRLVRSPFPTALVALKGNHEELLEAFLRRSVRRRALAASWRARDHPFLPRASRRADAGQEL